MIHVTLMPHVPTQEAATLVSVPLDTLEVGTIAQVCFCVSYYASLLLRFVFQDINECDDGTNACDGNATCSDAEGSYECFCNNGYSGDGYSCQSELLLKALIEFELH